MKTIITAILLLAASQASAGWENVFQSDELSTNWQGHVSQSTSSGDPVAEAYPGNPDLFAGHEAGDVIDFREGPNSYDLYGRGNPELDTCGCI